MPRENLIFADFIQNSDLGVLSVRDCYTKTVLLQRLNNAAAETNISADR